LLFAAYIVERVPAGSCGAVFLLARLPFACLRVLSLLDHLLWLQLTFLLDPLYLRVPSLLASLYWLRISLLLARHPPLLLARVL